MSPPPRTPGDADRDLADALALVRQLQPALEQDDRERQNAIVRRLAQMRAPMGDQWQRLANMAAGNGELGLARKAIDLFVESRGGAPYAHYLKAALLEQAGALREAYALMCSLPENVPDPAANAYSRGTAALFLGAREEARNQLERATRLRPQSGAAWLSLAMSTDLGREPELAERIIAAESTISSADPAQRAVYFHALGKAHAERGEHALAFESISRGARQLRTLTSYDREKDRRNAEESLRGYDAAAIAETARQQSEPTNRAIFVTGLPRSGTTLVEQILTSHSAVGGGGEIHRLEILAREMRGHSFPAIARHVEARGAADIARLWHHLLDERVPTPGRIVDKSLSTTRLLGIAATLLPDAPLIWVTRDPLDRAWSCFRTFFAAGMAWSCDLEDIAFHFRLEDELLRRWQEILGDRLLVVPYASLIESPEEWTRRIAAHCGLSEERQMFSPHESERTVTTASVMQVRRPINRDGIGSAEPYREFLEPFVRAYAG